MVIKRIAVVGAGIAGLACARRLVASGHEVSVYDKSRGVGGRAATRRIKLGAGDLCFDHGAQYFTARDPDFRCLVARLLAAGAIENYPNTVTSITDTERTVLPDEPRFVGAAGMNGMAKALADGLDIATSCQVSQCRRHADGWTLVQSTGAETGLFDEVVIAVPAEQAADLLLPVAPLLAQQAKAAHTSPCWAAMLAFSPPIKVGFEAARVSNASPIAWVAPMKGNGEDHSCWVLHARSDWSEDNINQSAEWVAEELARAFLGLAGVNLKPLQASAHRWRYAQVQASAGSPFSLDEDLRIGVCGDWRLGPRIELAWQSGDALGLAMSQTSRR
jgi:predicted NAD/FAD-dependent oxidoreductase